jgi:Mlc titration factor MtfA (ptsG expression regulator)
MQLLYLLFVLFGLIIFIAAFLYKPKRPSVTQLSPEKIKRLLNEEVSFYQQITPEKKKNFEERVNKFLSSVRINGVKTVVEDLDRVLVASSAVIPIFGFDKWEYPNLREVLLYPGGFDDSFRQEGEGRNTLGVVGSGAYRNVMILSQQALRESFSNKTGKSNVGIHEFVHLVDSVDGSYDGLPEILLHKKYVMPWLKLIHDEMKNIETNQSDINPYALTNEAEFYAVVSEYFFTQPELLKKKHPELYDYLQKIFVMRVESESAERKKSGERE